MGNENKRRKEKEEKRDGKFACRPATPYPLSLSLLFYLLYRCFAFV
jgi:hypothetical protein